MLGLCRMKLVFLLPFSSKMFTWLWVWAQVTDLWLWDFAIAILFGDTPFHFSNSWKGGQQHRYLCHVHTRHMYKLGRFHYVDVHLSIIIAFFIMNRGRDDHHDWLPTFNIRFLFPELNLGYDNGLQTLCHSPKISFYNFPPPKLSESWELKTTSLGYSTHRMCQWFGSPSDLGLHRN